MVSKYDIGYFRKLANDRGAQCLSDTFVNVRTKLRFRCMNGHEWDVEPRKVIEGRWCKQCVRENARKYSVKDDLFSSDSETAFYLAGFWAADGWKTRASGAYTVAVQLSAKDVAHLIAIRSSLESSSPLRYSRGQSPSSNTVTHSYIFSFSSEQIFNDLERFGVTERKTYTYQMPEWLMEHPLLHHFLRGYIDGDGCFNVAQNKKQGPHINFSMRGTSVFLGQFKEVLEREGVITREDRRDMAPKVGAKAPTFDKIQLGGNGICSRLYDYLYRDCTICLERKREVASKAKEFAVYGTDRKKQRKSTALPITKEILLEKAKQYRNQKKIAEHFGVTPAAISWWVKEFGIRDDMQRAMGKVTREEVWQLYEALGTQAAVARHLGLTKSRIGQILKH
jgi:DNA-binding transcriptional regulator YdaS (Cro superfamily)